MNEPDHKDLVLGLLGSTFGDLKKLDDSITSTSSTLGRRSDVVKQELQKMVATTLNQRSPSSPPQPIFQPQIFQPPVQMQPITVPQSEPPVPTNQLEFDFNRAAKYDDLIEIIERLEKKIEALDKKIDSLSTSARKTPTTKPVKKKIDVPVPVESIEPPVVLIEDKKKDPGILS